METRIEVKTITTSSSQIHEDEQKSLDNNNGNSNSGNDNGGTSFKFSKLALPLIISPALVFIIFTVLFVRDHQLIGRLYEVDCRVAGCWRDGDYYCHFAYNGTNNNNNSSAKHNEFTNYEYLGSLKVASTEQYYTSGKNGEADFLYRRKVYAGIRVRQSLS